MSGDGGPFLKRVLVGLRREKRLKAPLKELSGQFWIRTKLRVLKVSYGQLHSIVLNFTALWSE